MGIYKAGTILHIDELVRVCGYFTSRTDANNGYGCRHHEQEEVDRESGHGKCYEFSCPLARRVLFDDPNEDGSNPDRDLMIAQGFDPDSCSPEEYLELYDDLDTDTDPRPPPRVWHYSTQWDCCECDACLLAEEIERKVARGEHWRRRNPLPSVPHSTYRPCSRTTSPTAGAKE